MVVVVISGKPGSGSSTVAKLLAKKLKLKHFSVGDYNKRHSKMNNETEKAIDMWKLPAAKLKKFHIKSDIIGQQHAKRGNVVIDGKLQIHFSKKFSDLCVWIEASDSVRSKRYAKRGNVPINVASKELKEKEKLERKNWEKIYGFDYFYQKKNADIVINTGHKTPDEITDLIISKLKKVIL